jgi:endonuclease V-like protein UPF0215 family
VTRSLSHVVGFDDAPFASGHRGNVLVVGAVFAGTRLDGVVSCQVRRDGANATAALTDCIRGSRYFRQLHAVLLQGIAFAGFNVVDLPMLHASLRLPVLVVSRRRPNLATIRAALLGPVPGGVRKWKLIEKAGPMEPTAGLYVQRAGITPEEARSLLQRLAVNGALPEPLRVAHLIAGGIARGQSSGRP